MAMDLHKFEENELLSDFFELEKICTNDLSDIPDDELKLLYERLYAAYDYYNGMQLITKLAANAVYGACGSAYYRFFNPRVAEDITTEGKLAMMKVDKIINGFFLYWHENPEIEKKFKERFGDHIKLSPITKDICVYGDTDSRYVNFGEVCKCANYHPHSPSDVIDFVLFCEDNYIQKEIADGLHDYVVNKGGDPQYFIMELETIGGKGLYLKKKKYVMSLFWKDGANIASKGKIKSIGVEIVQGSSSKFVKDSMLKVVKMLLTPKSRIDNIFKIAKIIVEQARVQPPKALMKTNSANKYDDYVVSTYPKLVLKKKISAQLKAAAAFNHFIQTKGLTDRFPRFLDGQKIFWYYCKAGEPYETFGIPDGVEFEDIPEAPQMDVEKQVQKLIINPLKKYIFTEDFDSKTFGQDVMQIAFKPQVKL